MRKPCLAAVVMASLGLWVTSARGDQVVCVADGTGGETCDIFLPNVLDPVTAYPTIAFAPGDSVVVTAQGCVQTGGAGKTWKRYVDPSRPDSDSRYHGLISIPGATAGLVRLSSVVNTPLNVTSAGVLSLGYEDEGHGDNGYWSPDDGTDDQCAIPGDPQSGHFLKARIRLQITRAGPPFPRAGIYGHCAPIDGTQESCRIDRPEVTRPEEGYQSIVLRPGERVALEAGGCVQTGGAGKTWKRYVDPTGPGADDVVDHGVPIPGRYRGLISIPGVTTGSCACRR